MVFTINIINSVLYPTINGSKRMLNASKRLLTESRFCLEVVLHRQIIQMVNDSKQAN